MGMSVGQESASNWEINELLSSKANVRVGRFGRFASTPGFGSSPTGVLGGGRGEGQGETFGSMLGAGVSYYFRWLRLRLQVPRWAGEIVRKSHFNPYFACIIVRFRSDATRWQLFPLARLCHFASGMFVYFGPGMKVMPTGGGRSGRSIITVRNLTLVSSHSQSPSCSHTQTSTHRAGRVIER